ncbi:MAG: DUF6152 family protein [Tagaea sp.]|nr:DUF6152 family protein [Tagaea sp.]
MSLSRRVFLGSSLFVAGAGTASAHHGWSGFNSDQVLRISGRIAAMTFDNPHGMLTLRTEGGEWSIELAPPFRMRARGLEPEAMAPGTEAVLEGYPHRQTARLMRAERIVIAGRTTELR